MDYIKLENANSYTCFGIKITGDRESAPNVNHYSSRIAQGNDEQVFLKKITR